MNSTILIVDDEQGDIHLFRRVLERAGYHVLTASDPRAALDILEDHPVDLLLTDVWMPTMDGFHLIARARASQPGIATLMMTGYGSVDTAIQALHRGVDGLVLKQFENTGELVQVVEQTLEESRKRREAARAMALRPLFDITEQLLSETSPERLESLIVDVIRTTFQGVFAVMYCRRTGSNRLERVRAVGEAPPDEAVDALAELAEQTCAWGASAVLLPQGHLQDVGWQACLAAPVQRREGYMFFTGRAKGAAQFTEADLDMFVILCSQAVVVLEHARLYDELKINLQRLAESQRALVQTEKMAAVGRLIASLAHEINNPLQAVRNGLHLLMRDDVDAVKRNQYLEMTRGEVERLVQTVQRMLDFSRASSTEKRPVELMQMIEAVTNLLGSQLRDQGVEMQLKYHDENVDAAGGSSRTAVFAVPDQIEQVILNLLINAMDALEEKYRSAACSTPLQKQVWIDIYNVPGGVRVLVEDSGCGIPADLGDQIFEPFISTKPHGTGLGLSVSYEIIERHGGSLAIVPARYGTGACFSIWLPS